MDRASREFDKVDADMRNIIAVALAVCALLAGLWFVLPARVRWRGTSGTRQALR